MTKMIQRCTQLTILPEGDPIFSENATNISIEDEACGEYIRITQYTNNHNFGEVNINPEDWKTLRDAIDTMVASCRKEDA